MELTILWLALSVIAGIIAGNKGRSFFGFFLLALVLSPIVGLVAALVAQPSSPAAPALAAPAPPTHDGKTCPYCAETIQPAAVVCRYCGRDLPAEAEPDETAIMAKYGITQQGDRYLYQGNRYAKLPDAVAYAKKQRGSAHPS